MEKKDVDIPLCDGGGERDGGWDGNKEHIVG
jgi:hypothetical protein